MPDQGSYEEKGKDSQRNLKPDLFRLFSGGADTKRAGSLSQGQSVIGLD